MRVTRLLMIVVLLGVFLQGQAYSKSSLVERFLESRRVVSTVYFDNNSYNLSEEYQLQLLSLIETLKNEIAKGRLIRAEGFASKEGREVYSFKLSMQRAKTVVDFFNSLDVLPEIYLTGYGDQQSVFEQEPRSAWRVELASYENIVDATVIENKSHTLEGTDDNDPPVSNKSLLNFKMGHMEALTNFNEPIIIDKFAVEQVLMEKLASLPFKSIDRSVTQINFSEADQVSTPEEGVAKTQ